RRVVVIGLSQVGVCEDERVPIREGLQDLICPVTLRSIVAIRQVHGNKLMAFSFKQVEVCRVVAFFPRPAIGGVLPILRSCFIALRWEVVIENVVAEGPPTIVMVTWDNPVWNTGVINDRLHLRGELKFLASLFFRMMRKHPVLDDVTG